MKDRTEKRKLITFITISVAAVAFFALLAFMFPYTGDDWAWGSSIGISRLQSWFENYNGRYMGNLLVMTMTRSLPVRVIIMALSYYAACLMCCKYTPRKDNASLLFALVLFFMMPRSMLAQSVVWTAGYANYVPSALIVVAYLLIIKNITGDEAPKYPKYLFILTALMGFVGAPFIENVALFNICLGVAVIGYTALKFKRACAAHFGFLAGAVLGAVWMFSNSGYGVVSGDGDGIRSTPKGLKNIISTCIDHGYAICDNLINSNYVMCAVVCLLLIILTVRFIRTTPSKKARVAAACIMAVNILCTFFIICKDIVMVYTYLYASMRGMMSFLGSKKLQVVLALLFAVTVLLQVLLCVEKGRRFRMLLPFYCVPVVVAPLLVVNPIGPRCFFAPYLLLMVFAVDLFGYITRDVDPADVGYKALLGGLALVVALQAFVYVSIFYPIFKYDTKRNELAELQAQNGQTTIVVSKLPHEAYLWTSTPGWEPWGTRYKLFHGIDEEAELEIVSPKEFDKFYDEYKNR